MSKVLLQKTIIFSIELYIILYIPENGRNGKNYNVLEFMFYSSKFLTIFLSFKIYCFLNHVFSMYYS